MPKCQHYKICGRDALEGTGEPLCILHSQNPDKDKNAFDEAWNEHRNEKGDHFNYFVFPIFTDFSNIQFTGKPNFVEAKFRGEANFQDTEFMGETYFWGAEFTGEANFQYAKFTEKASFDRATFAGGARFGGAIFTLDADFSEARFRETAEFSEVAFMQHADFSRANFTATATFNNATFKEEAWFIGCTFTMGAMFGNSVFAKNTDFGYCDFSFPTFFAGSSFGEANFVGARFTTMTHFCQARFCGRVAFSPGIQEDEHRTRVFSGAEVNFQEVMIEHLDALTFRDADLTGCSFQGTDLRKAELAGVTWPKIGSRFGVYDEIEAARKGETDRYSHIEHLYRQLKQNHEDRKDYERAGDFHYGEKEMRRKNPDTSRGLRCWLILYCLVSGYGERWIRPLICAVGLLAVCAALYLCLGLQPKNGGPALTCSSAWDWLRSAFYSFRVMTLLRPDDLAPFGYAKLVHAFESLLGPLLLGLFALAVRQKLKR